MTDQARSRRNAASALLPLATAVLAAAIFVVDILTPPDIVVTVLYVAVVLMATRFCQPRSIVLVAAGCSGLAVVGYVLSAESASNTALGILAIALTTVLALQTQSAQAKLLEQASLLDLTHDSIVARRFDDDVITHWNRGAEELYGWQRAEAVGKVGSELRKTAVPLPLDEIKAELQRAGRWEGELVNNKQDGTPVIVASRWSLQRDRHGRPSVILVTSNDITERRRGEQRIAAQFAVTRVLAEADSFAGAVPEVLRAIGENLEWGWGSLWSFDWQRESHAAPLRCDIVWRAPDIATTDFDTVSREWSFGTGEGLVGQVWRTGKPIWMLDVAAEPSFLRGSAAAKAGLHGGVIFPILLDAQSLGVVEFYSRAGRERDEEQLATLSAIGSQIGQFIKRQRAEAALRASEERWRKLFETSAAGMALTQLDGVFTAVNPALQRMLGRAEEEIVGRSFLELNPEEERAATAEALEKFRRGALTERQVEKKYLKKDGSPVWLNITTTLVPATETAAPFLQVVYMDITERVQAEAALRASEERWRAIFESAAVGIAAGDLRGGLFDVNPTFQRMLGYTEEELRDLRAFEFTHEDDRAETRRLFSRVVAGQQPSYRLEKRYRRKDGAIVWADVSASLVPATESAPAFLAVMAVDITDRKHAEAELRASEARLENAQRMAHVGWWERDFSTNHVSLSKEVGRIFGVEPVDLPDWHNRWLDLIHPADRPKAAESAAVALRGGPRYDVEYRVARPDGGVRIVHSQGDVTWDASGRPLRQFGVLQDVTELRQAEAALRTSEERWRLMFETSSAGIGLFRLDGVCTAANPALQRMLSRAEQEIVGHSAVELTHVDERAETLNVIARFNSGLQHEYHVEKRFLRPDGNPVWLSATTTLVPATESAEPFLQAIYINITDRKRAEAALRASEERWRLMFETAPVGITMLDFEHRRYLAANAAFQRMTGYAEDELRQLTVLDVTHEDDRAATQKRISEATLTVPQQKRYRRKDGGVIWADVTAFVVPATESTPAFLGAVTVDITDRKRAEDALRRSEAYLNKVFDTIPDGVAIVTRDYRYQRVNPVYERRTALGAHQMIGMHSADVNGAEAFNEIIKPELDRCFAGEQVSYGHWFTHPGSGRRHLSVTYSPLFIGDSNRPAAALVISRDLTDYVMAQEALQQAQADLARLNRVMLLEEMAASIAHEVNQPIAAVITNASAGLRWLGARQPDLEEVRQALGRIVRDGTRAGEVIARIRALVKQAPPRRDELDINQAIHEVLALTQTELQRHNVRLQRRLADDLPLVSADRIQLQQVIINLVVNAIEAMAGAAVGQQAREITVVSGKDDDSQVFVEVQDTGPGIDPEQLDRLFQSFYTTKPDGIGMGLAISRSIAEAHGGRLSAAPNKSRGAIFRLTLPVENGLAGKMAHSAGGLATQT